MNTKPNCIVEGCLRVATAGKLKATGMCLTHAMHLAETGRPESKTMGPLAERMQDKRMKSTPTVGKQSSFGRQGRERFHWSDDSYDHGGRY